MKTMDRIDEMVSMKCHSQIALASYIFCSNDSQVEIRVKRRPQIRYSQKEAVFHFLPERLERKHPSTT